MKLILKMNDYTLRSKFVVSVDAIVAKWWTSGHSSRRRGNAREEEAFEGADDRSSGVWETVDRSGLWLLSRCDKTVWKFENWIAKVKKGARILFYFLKVCCKMQIHKFRIYNERLNFEVIYIYLSLGVFGLTFYNSKVFFEKVIKNQIFWLF